ncbi:iron permease FTR1 family-domain-containing protein [Endogone sp. FLAS-F59071]|nr:iron permease FTR1 family-domain-containing protein [Endogone sp. FLAS-F59071]|eukprot:RUS14133.1 iron permease FTR1 family-domain-containing protein [Endogone sp. FLAS-F59071]
MTTDLFSVPIFFVLFRETLEAAVIVSILLAVLRQLFPDNPKILQRLNRQVWLGTILGLIISISIGAAFVAVWYTVAADLWLTTEDLWEGSFSLFATVLITIMAIAMLKTSRMQDKWKHKLVKALDAHLNETESGNIKGDKSGNVEGDKSGNVEGDIDKQQKIKFGRIKAWGKAGGKMNRRRALFLLPLITVTREGLEAMIFMSGLHFDGFIVSGIVSVLI